MAKINYSLSAKVDKITGKAEIHIRFIGGRDFVFRAKTGLEVKPGRFKNGSIVAPRIETDEQKELIKLKTKLSDLENYMLDRFTNADKTIITNEWLKVEVDKWRFPEKYTTDRSVKEISFFEIFDEFLIKHPLSKSRINAYMVVHRSMRRYELYSGKKITFDSLTADVLRSYDKFLREEHAIYDKHPKIYKAVPETRKPEKRGQNTVSGILTKIRTFVLWSIKNGYTKNNPFDKFVIPECKYGTPYYITTDERKLISALNLSDDPFLEAQRDIFIFHCVIGCRIGDLEKFKKNNIIGGSLEFVAGKTKENAPITLRVSLNSTAKNILAKYSDIPGERLLPFTYDQEYNRCIKKIFTKAEITRLVTVINPTTREEEKQPLNEIASSHICRKTFIGNLYKKTKDPNMIGALTGHVEGSKAFARYKTVDDEMKQELVDLLD